jgi:DNA-binding NarL/FixJ family response regulator
MANKVQILIADNHPIVRQGLRHTIEAEDWLEIVCETGTGEETLAAVRKEKTRLSPA